MAAKILPISTQEITSPSSNFYRSSVNFVCSVQPDKAVTQRKLGHAQKKSLLKFQKGLMCYSLGKLFDFIRFFVFFLYSVFIIWIKKLIVWKTSNVNVSYGFVNTGSEFLEIFFVGC